ncbi:5'-nucleotidase [Tamaricihabitans halophyticus]|uniref:5'-nucleotidase n=1 Tax=Tamaricihabitans halophyticus TaxID=1262583 RepID=A0A4R2R5D7_9PSEU|nr:5'-nucleotidase C-terminal domain-containing protein [Tamaricihabitans halophyticus]TCP56999.1 5'-nucleotidase [Tamaricihabitans halophyticus]
MPTRLPRRRTLAVGALLASAAILTGGLPATAAQTTAAQSTAGSTDVRLIAFNDLHGNLEPPAGSSGEVTLDDGSTVPAGGASYLATHINQLRKEAPNSLVLSSGDSIGASPLPSALFHDEPTMALLRQLDVRASAVGNHEFDEGLAELRRMQRGGCHPEDGCQFRDSYPGAGFPILGANVKHDNGLPAMPPFTIELVGGVPVGIIGLPLEDTPEVVAPEAVEGLKFGSEVAAINRASKALSALGVRAQTVLMHNGDEAEGGPNACAGPAGPAREISEQAAPEVDVFFQAHSHSQYNCTVTDPAGEPRPVIQGLSYGRLLSVVDLSVDRRTGDVLREQTTARNLPVTRDVPPDPATEELVNEAVEKSAPIANEPVGSITEDINREAEKSGESALGNVIADAQLVATAEAGAQLALMNPGGIRENLSHAGSPANEGDGVVTYGEAYAVQPFGNILQTITLTGEQLRAVLEQQWRQDEEDVVLQVSSTLRYSWSASAPVGAKVSDITIDGKPVDPNAEYRVTVNNFLSTGGDGFTELREGADLQGGAVDLDAFTAYLGANENLGAPATDRITVLD